MQSKAYGGNSHTGSGIAPAGLSSETVGIEEKTETKKMEEELSKSQMGKIPKEELITWKETDQTVVFPMGLSDYHCSFHEKVVRRDGQ
ncbi:hypothetical protein GPALN_010326 [Globodera pallida]|nr:hypothetical protein GPALN_010326 [Globodera pallida]